SSPAPLGFLPATCRRPRGRVCRPRTPHHVRGVLAPIRSCSRGLGHDGLARWALAQRRCLAGLALLMRRGCGAAIDVERPFDMVLGQTVTEYGTGMVEDDCAVLALGRPQHAANHLPE